MTKSVSKTSQSALVGFAVFLFGMAMYEMNVGALAVAVFLYVLVAIVAFFVYVVDTPTNKLAVDLRQLQKVLDNVTNVQLFIKEMKEYLPELDSIIALISSGKDMKAILKSLKADAPALEALITQFLEQLSEHKIDLTNVNWATLISDVIKDIMPKE